MSYLRTFAPWIVYAVIPSQYWQWSALISVAVAAGLIWQQRRAGRGLDSLILDLGSAVFFAAVAVVAFADPNSAVHAYMPAISSGVLAVIAGVSLLIRVPFTLPIAKETTPQEFWDQPLFIRTAYVLTSVWTASFVIGCLALTVLAHGATGARVGVQVLAFVVPAVFTLRYVAYIQGKARAALGELAE
ncbi:hypothetical protein GPX89_13430 [Nocardia sp. ET3-3]|uniref:DUF3159 domain-containing protein n=1 Tax=Nocardia terrae TaxID=2675851 RepID=A0A7K1UVE2_9NOCA|nr:hypothetical protein [Nocardia terrae]MVU78241.1 hypothetical protein [Nocardia terrae]